MVKVTDKKSVSMGSIGSKPVDVFCFNFYFPIRKENLALAIRMGYTDRIAWYGSGYYCEAVFFILKYSPRFPTSISLH